MGSGMRRSLFELYEISPLSSVLSPCTLTLCSVDETRVLPVQQKTRTICPGLKSDRRGSNPRSRPWQGRALPTTPLSQTRFWKCFPQRQDILYHRELRLSNVFLIFFEKIVTIHSVSGGWVIVAQYMFRIFLIAVVPWTGGAV